MVAPVMDAVSSAAVKQADFATLTTRPGQLASVDEIGLLMGGSHGMEAEPQPSAGGETHAA